MNKKVEETYSQTNKKSCTLYIHPVECLLLRLLILAIQNNPISQYVEEY